VPSSKRLLVNFNFKKSLGLVGQVRKKFLAWVLVKNVSD